MGGAQSHSLQDSTPHSTLSRSHSSSPRPHDRAFLHPNRLPPLEWMPTKSKMGRADQPSLPPSSPFFSLAACLLLIKTTNNEVFGFYSTQWPRPPASSSARGGETKSILGNGESFLFSLSPGPRPLALSLSLSLSTRPSTPLPPTYISIRFHTHARMHARTHARCTRAHAQWRVLSLSLFLSPSLSVPLSLFLSLTPSLLSSHVYVLAWQRNTSMGGGGGKIHTSSAADTTISRSADKLSSLTGSLNMSFLTGFLAYTLSYTFMQARTFIHTGSHRYYYRTYMKIHWSVFVSLSCL